MNGAARARQTLARIALGSDDPATTERYARESLQMGRFKAKTVASWRLLVAARGRQDKRPLDADLVESLAAPPMMDVIRVGTPSRSGAVAGGVAATRAGDR